VGGLPRTRRRIIHVSRNLSRALQHHFVIGCADPGQNPPAVRSGSSRVRGRDLGRAEARYSASAGPPVPAAANTVSWRPDNALQVRTTLECRPSTQPATDDPERWAYSYGSDAPVPVVRLVGRSCWTTWTSRPEADLCTHLCTRCQRPRDAAGHAETGKTTRDAGDAQRGLSPGQRDGAERRRRWETRVVWLITQRSRVQIPPPLPRPEAPSRTEKGPLACRLLTDLLTRLGLMSSCLGTCVSRGKRAADDQLGKRGRDPSGTARWVYVPAPPASSVTVTAGQPAQAEVPGRGTRDVTLDPGDHFGHSGQKPRARPEPARTGRGPSPAQCGGHGVASRGKKDPALRFPSNAG